MKKRLIWADMLRILAIYLVIQVHSSVLPRSPFISALLGLALFAIAKTCVPLFFMLSGALLLAKNEGTIFFLRKRFFRIFIPYLFWVIIFIIFLFSFSPPHTIKETLQIISTGFRGFWFLPILFILYLATPSLRIYVKHEKKTQLFLVITLWFVLVSFLPYIRNTLAFPLQFRNDILSQVIDYSGYYLLGYLLITTSFIKNKKAAFSYITIGLIWSIGATVFLSQKIPTFNPLYFEYISPSNVFLSTGIFGLFLNLNTNFAKLPTRVKQAAATISSLIFGVYLLHTVVIQIFNRINFSLPHTFLPVIFDVPLIALITFICTLSIVLLLSRIPYLKRLIT